MRRSDGNSLLSIALGFLMWLSLVAPAAAAGPINTTADNVAIQGYDAVAYFREQKPVRGSPEFEHVWQGARWQFSGAEHRDIFAMDPLSYAPRYGGFCSGGMTFGHKSRVDPEAWAIVDGTLYLAFSAGAMRRFTSDVDSNIAKADANWELMDEPE